MGAEPLRLLLVDDHDLLSGALSLALRARGLDVATSSGPAATDVVDAARRRAASTSTWARSAPASTWSGRSSRRGRSLSCSRA
jgi:ActR/RegA family two-component response regulator